MTDIDIGLTPEEILRKMQEIPWQYYSSCTKPIVVIYLPAHFNITNSVNEPMELMYALNNGFGHPNDGESKRKYTDYWKDYYWFCFTKYDIETPEFKVFHPKDFTDIQFQELKDMVLADLEAMKIRPE